MDDKKRIWTVWPEPILKSYQCKIIKFKLI